MCKIAESALRTLITFIYRTRIEAAYNYLNYTLYVSFTKLAFILLSKYGTLPSFSFILHYALR